jgi:hypothetical protein
MAFEVFKRVRWRSPTEPTVTLTTGGRISLNVAIINALLEDNRFTTLMYDRERRLVGIKFAKSSDPTTYPIFVNKPKSSAGINANAFLRNYDIVPTSTTNYKAIYDKKSKILTFSVEK